MLIHPLSFPNLLPEHWDFLGFTWKHHLVLFFIDTAATKYGAILSLSNYHEYKPVFNSSLSLAKTSTFTNWIVMSKYDSHEYVSFFPVHLC